MSTPGARKLDQIISVTPGDVHLIQPPGPSPPLPVPHPVPNSLIKDNVADQVKVMGMAGAVKGSISQHTPPHIPIGGTFVNKPSNKGEVITGSSNVFYQGKAATMMGETAKMCCDPSEMPVGKVIGKAAMVLVGGGGSGGGGDGSGDGTGKKAGGAGGAGLGVVTGTGDPVDVATGNVIVSGDDFGLDGPLPIQFVRTYVSANAATQGPLGYGWVHNFQESMELVTEGHPEWKRIHQELTEAGNPSPDNRYIFYRDPNGLATNYRLPREGEELIDGFHHRRLRRDGNTCSLTNRFGIVSCFAHVAGPATRLQLFEVIDRNGNKNLFRYSPEGQLTEVEDCYGRTLIIDCQDDRVAEIRLRISRQQPAERWCSYKYDEAGDLVEAIDRAGFSVHYAYADHLILQNQNRDGYSFFFAYDQQRRCIQTWGQDGYLTRYLSYDTQKLCSREINGEGELTIYYYTPAGVVWRTQKGTNFYTETTFDEFGRQLAQNRGGVTRFSFDYDVDGNISAIIDAEGAAITYKHNSTGQVVSQTDPLGHDTTFDYDQRGNMARWVGPSGATIRYEHDQRGRTVRELHPDGRTVLIDYDSFGHYRRVADGDRVTTYQYDPLGNPLSISPPASPSFVYEWNDQGLLKRVIVDNKPRISLSYNKEGDITEMLDARNFLHCFRFRALGVVIEEAHYAVEGETRVLQSQIHYETDLEGRVISATDHLQRKARYVYDSTSRLVKETRFDGCVIERDYNVAGQVEEVRTSRGDVERFRYDKRGLQTQLLYQDGSTDDFDYDECGRLVSATNSWGTVEYEYDELGRQAVRRQGEFELRVEVDKASGAVSWCLPEGIAAEYRKDTRGLIDSVSFGGRRFDFNRDRVGQLVSCAYPNGLAQSYEYDQESRFAGLTLKRDGSTLLRRSISCQDGKIVGIQEDDRTRAFRYDPLHRLAEVQGPAREFYQFDQRNNLVASHRFGKSRVVEDRLESAGDRTYTYDSRGRVAQIRDGERVFAFDYDVKSQIARVRLPDGAQVRYQYDVFGRRVEKCFERGNRDGQRILFFWDGNNLAKEEHFANEELVSESFYLFSGLAPLARIDRENGEDRAIFYHNSHNGMPALCTDEKGEVVWSYVGDSFGYEAVRENEFQNLRFPGQYLDEETGLYYNRYRYFDPFISRYLQPDPIVKPSDVNRYTYPLDPLTSLDPNGLDTMILNGDPNDPAVSGGFVPGYGPYVGGVPSLLKGNPGAVDANLYDTHGPDLRGVDHVIINTHGDPHHLWITDQHDRLKSRPISGKELAAYLKARGFTGNRVTIIACNTGAPGSTVAQDVADGLGPNVEVSAPSNFVGVDAQGTPRIQDAAGRLTQGDMMVFQAGMPPRVGDGYISAAP